MLYPAAARAIGKGLHSTLRSFGYDCLWIWDNLPPQVEKSDYNALQRNNGQHLAFSPTISVWIPRQAIAVAIQYQVQATIGPGNMNIH
ncbi:unnamed protein product [Rotaria socialis]